MLDYDDKMLMQIKSDLISLISDLAKTWSRLSPSGTNYCGTFKCQIFIRVGSLESKIGVTVV